MDQAVVDVEGTSPFGVKSEECPAHYGFSTDGTCINVWLHKSLWKGFFTSSDFISNYTANLLKKLNAIRYLPEDKPLFQGPVRFPMDFGFGALISTKISEDKRWAILRCPLPMPMPEPMPKDYVPTYMMEIYCANLHWVVNRANSGESSAKEHQLATVNGIRLGESHHGLGVYISRMLARWVGGLGTEQGIATQYEVSKAMRTADRFIMTGVANPKGANKHDVYADLSGESCVSLHCGSGMICNMGGRYGSDQSGYDLICDNLYGPWQTLVTFTGLAKLCEIARADLALNPLVIK